MYTYVYIYTNMYTHVYMYTNIYTYVFICLHMFMYRASHVALVVKNLPANARDIREAGLIPGSGRYSGEVNGNRPENRKLPPISPVAAGS